MSDRPVAYLVVDSRRVPLVWDEGQLTAERPLPEDLEDLPHELGQAIGMVGLDYAQLHDPLVIDPSMSEVSVVHVETAYRLRYGVTPQNQSQLAALVELVGAGWCWAQYEYPLGGLTQLGKAHLEALLEQDPRWHAELLRERAQHFFHRARLAGRSAAAFTYHPAFRLTNRRLAAQHLTEALRDLARAQLLEKT